MPDKPKDEQAAQRHTRASKHSPKEPQQDYSSLPQKSIKLKPDVTVPSALKRAANMPQTEKQHPAPAKKRQKKPARQPPKIFGDVSPQARKVAAAAAAQESVPLNVWLEKLILQSQQTMPDGRTDDLDHMMQSLRKIEQQLERIENQKGFWSRFWEQFMEPHRRSQ